MAMLLHFMRLCVHQPACGFLCMHSGTVSSKMPRESHLHFAFTDLTQVIESPLFGDSDLDSDLIIGDSRFAPGSRFSHSTISNLSVTTGQ